MKSRPIELSVWRARSGHLLAAVGLDSQACGNSAADVILTIANRFNLE
jgi:hypothetical protein